MKKGKPLPPIFPPATPRVRAAEILTASLAVAIAVAGCAPKADRDHPYDVLIYVLDACRADRIGYYGYERPTTPAIDEIASDPDAVVYRRHYVAGNWTKPATASLFTSTWVHQHGVTNPIAETEDGLFWAETLADGYVTLAEAFQNAGYSTFGLVTSHLLAQQFGFDQGFDVYFDPESLPVGDTGRIEKFAELTEDLASPYFAYIHQNACHYPFPPSDRDPDFMARFGFDYDEERRASLSIDFSGSAIRDAIASDEVELTDEDVRFLSLIYDAKLRDADRRAVRPMIEHLKRVGSWDRTLFIITADHGEELYEHGDYAHGFAMWEASIHVPLVVKFPLGMRPKALSKEVRDLTSNVDLYPSLLSFLGLPSPGDLVGRQIFDASNEGVVFSQGLTNYPAKGATDWCVIKGWNKLVHQRNGQLLLFDLHEDPEETRDLAKIDPARVRALEAVSEEAGLGRTASAALEIETELTEEAIEELRSLGYLD